MGLAGTFAAACILLAGLLAIAPDSPHITPASAASHEGQAVQLSGLVVDARPWSDQWRLDVAHDGHAVAVIARAMHPVGGWITAQGVVQRVHGELLVVADRVGAADVPSPPRVPLAALANHDWMNRWIEVRGDATGHVLRDGATSLQLSKAMSGPVVVHGVVQDDAACLCKRMLVAQSTPWIR